MRFPPSLLPPGAPAPKGGDRVLLRVELYPGYLKAWTLIVKRIDEVDNWALCTCEADEKRTVLFMGEQMFALYERTPEERMVAREAVRAMFDEHGVEATMDLVMLNRLSRKRQRRSE